MVNSTRSDDLKGIAGQTFRGEKLGPKINYMQFKFMRYQTLIEANRDGIEKLEQAISDFTFDEQTREFKGMATTLGNSQKVTKTQYYLQFSKDLKKVVRGFYKDFESGTLTRF